MNQITYTFSKGITLLLLAALAPGCDAADGRETEPTLSLEQQVDAYVQPYLDLSFFNGAVLIARQDEILLRKAYGMADYAQRTPNTPQSQFRMASISKAFTQMAIGKLVEQGLLDWQATLDTFIPDYPRGDEITVEHLVKNRSGVPHINSLPWYHQLVEHDYSLEALIDQFKNEPLAFTPGTQMAYSNGGFVLMALLIEQASGQSYGAFMEEEIFRPLGMNDSGHDRRGLALPRRAQGHLPGLTALDERVHAPYVEMSLKIGGGSLYSTVEDLYRWDRALFKDNVLKASTYATLFPHSGTLTFSGRQPGFNAYSLRRATNDVTVIVLSNNYASGMLQQMAEAFAAMALGQSYDPPLVSTDVEVDAAALTSYTGRYQAPDGPVFEFRLDDGDLVVYENDEPQEILVPVTEDRFIIRVTWAELTFVKQADGSVSHIQVRFLVDGQTASLPKIGS